MSDSECDFITSVPLPNGFSAYNTRSKQFVCWRDGSCEPKPLVPGDSVLAVLFYYGRNVYWNAGGYYELSRNESSNFYSKGDESWKPSTKRTFTKHEIKIIGEASSKPVSSVLITAAQTASVIKDTVLEAYSSMQNSKESEEFAMTQACDDVLHRAESEHADQPEFSATTEVIEDSEVQPPVPSPPPILPLPVDPPPWFSNEIYYSHFQHQHPLWLWLWQYGWLCSCWQYWAMMSMYSHLRQRPIPPESTFRRGEIVRIVQGAYSGRWGRVKGVLGPGKATWRGAVRTGYRVRVDGRTVGMPTFCLLSLQQRVDPPEPDTSIEPLPPDEKWGDAEHAINEIDAEDDEPLCEFWIDRQPDPTAEL